MGDSMAVIETMLIGNLWTVAVDGMVDGDTGGHDTEDAAVAAFKAFYPTDTVLTSADRDGVGGSDAGQ